MLIVYGGAFNPPTIAHYEVVKKVVEQLNPQKIIFMPVADHYDKKDLIECHHRINMLNILAKKIDSNVIVSDIEKHQEKFRGTLHTLDEVADKYKTTSIGFIIGADNLLEISEWIRIDELLEKYKVIVLKRDNIDINKVIKHNRVLNKYQDKFIILNCFKQLDISSSEFRENQDKKSIVTNEVLKYINENNLYL